MKKTYKVTIETKTLKKDKYFSGTEDPKEIPNDVVIPAIEGIGEILMERLENREDNRKYVSSRSWDIRVKEIGE